MKGPRYQTLFTEARQWVRDVGRGAPVLAGLGAGRFGMLLLEAMRPHYFAFGGAAALAGAAAVPGPVEVGRVALAAFVAGTGWGVGQLFNDLLDRDTDAINAPGRPLADGRLPVGPVLAAALFLGLLLLAALQALHPAAWILGATAVVLLVGYNQAKGVPVLGNLVFGSINAVAGGIGVLARLPGPEASLSQAFESLGEALPLLGLLLGINAWFLLANYEKDRLGDRAAGYWTLPLLLGVRASAFLRAIALPALALGVVRLGAAPALSGQMALTVAAVLGGLSVLPSLWRGTDEAALRGYRLAVPASSLALLGLAAPLLGGVGLAIAALASTTLMEATFRRTPHP
ncbi:4-hydroxybenzoate polyprenyltransferase [Stigmatella aurantiaca]|uniref:4-hydroxybenzoate polyprenyltransferase n=1 Tax=Stigmatella aurantiaca TaxID=41 RepID=A0A1H7VBH4_STIAU|nr:UbiA family prenyltransferase [Stigmatella aurantiaca]SEM06265.1 4-hydroxybenzoate polyprenyltransferase [Stigmatella aurantiaca]